MSNKDQMKNIINAQQNYIKFLEKHFGYAEAFLSNQRGWKINKQAVIDGENHRIKIKKLSK